MRTTYLIRSSYSSVNSEATIEEKCSDRARERAVIAAQAAVDKQGERTIILDVSATLVVTDAFVITSGSNTRQVRTIVDEIERRLKAEDGGGPLRVEGRSDASWVLVDCGDVVVHVFLEETRAYYDLERLWADVPRIGWDETTAAVS